MLSRLFKFSPVAALLFFGLASNATPAAAGGCGYYGCGYAAPVVVYQQPSCGCCGCGSSYYNSYAPAYAYPSAYGYGYAGYADYADYGYDGYGYAGYGAGLAPYRYANRLYRSRGYVGARGRVGRRR